MSFFTGFGVSALIYWGLNYAFPPRGMASVFEEVDLSETAESYVEEIIEDDESKSVGKSSAL